MELSRLKVLTLFVLLSQECIPCQSMCTSTVCPNRVPKLVSVPLISVNSLRSATLKRYNDWSSPFAGLRFGMYSDAGEKTCLGYPGEHTTSPPGQSIHLEMRSCIQRSNHASPLAGACKRRLASLMITGC